MAKTTTELKNTWEVLLKKLATFEASELPIWFSSLDSTKEKQALIDFLNANSNPPVDMEVSAQVCLFDKDFPPEMSHPELCSLINHFSAMCRVLNNNPKEHAEIKKLCKDLIDFQSAQTQMLGWEHFSAYCTNAEEYEQKRHAILDPYSYFTERSFQDCRPKYIAFDHLISPELKAVVRKGEDLLQAFLQRIDTVLKIRNESFPKAARPSLEATLDVLLRVFKADTDFINKTAQFLKEAENLITTMIASNKHMFEIFKFREKKEKIRWPHSQQMRRTIEAAGLKFSPWLIKRDNCRCDTCQVEVSGWRPWHGDVMSFHDFSKHPGLKESIERVVERNSGLRLYEGVIPARHFVDPRPSSRHQFGEQCKAELEQVMAFSVAGNSAAAAVANPPVAEPMPTPTPTPTPTPRPASGI